MSCFGSDIVGSEDAVPSGIFFVMPRQEATRPDKLVMAKWDHEKDVSPAERYRTLSLKVSDLILCSSVWLCQSCLLVSSPQNTLRSHAFAAGRVESHCSFARVVRHENGLTVTVLQHPFQSAASRLPPAPACQE
eukprot:1206311-Amphidinium_carterae.1